ncbi:MAG: V-type ATPase subunit [Candidatus Bipolaricaulia bacterium]
MVGYEYLNARVHALKARLLRDRDYRALLDMDDVTDVIHYLDETDYGREIERSSVRFSGYPLIEDALVRHNERIFRKLYRMAPEGPRELLRIVFDRWEVLNLKTVLRGKHIGASEAEILENLRARIVHDRGYYRELTREPDVGTVIDYLLTIGSRYYQPLLDAQREYNETGNLAFLEHALDASYFSDSRRLLRRKRRLFKMEKNAELIRAALGTEVDLLNLIYALRVLEEAVEAEEKYRYIIPGGERLSTDFIQQLIDAGTHDRFFTLFRGTFYARKLDLDLEAGQPDAEAFQELVERYLFVEQCAIDLSRPFDIHLACAYIWRKYVETINLRVIATGIEGRIPKEEIQAQMIGIR